MADLKTDYKDDILVSGQQRKYNLIENSDGTVSLLDVSSYAQYGDTLKAEDFNATNAAVNALNGKTPFVEFHTQNVDLVEGTNDIYVSGYPKAGFDQWLLSGYAFLSDATTTPLCGTVDSSGRFRMLVNCSRNRPATAIRYYILYIPSS